jgi:hypothetical protein
VSKAIAHGAQLADRPVQFLRLSRQHLSVDTWLPVWREHPCDLIKGKPGCAAKRNQHQPFEYTGIEEAAQPSPADRRDQPLFLIEAQCRSRHAGLLYYYSFRADVKYSLAEIAMIVAGVPFYLYFSSKRSAAANYSPVHDETFP